MEPAHFSPQTLIADVLAVTPLAAPLFVEWRLDCLGCAMVRFCTLKDLSRYYELDLNLLIHTLKQRPVKDAGY